MNKKFFSILLAANLVVTTALLCSYTFGKKEESTVGRVTGIGGVFFKCKDPKATNEWYYTKLGLARNDYGSIFEWKMSDDNKTAYTQWSPFSAKTKYFLPSKKDFMINYRVDNMDALVAKLKAANVVICDTVENTDYGKFLHILDCDSNKVELWQPVDVVFENMYKGKTTK